MALVVAQLRVAALVRASEVLLLLPQLEVNCHHLLPELVVEAEQVARPYLLLAVELYLLQLPAAVQAEVLMAAA